MLHGEGIGEGIDWVKYLILKIFIDPWRVCRGEGIWAS